MYTLVAEKPSVGRELARITGCRDRKDGYYSGGFLNGEPCRVTWTAGHLCEMTDSPEERALHWRAENLPVLPQRFLLQPIDARSEKQLKVIENLLATTDTIVNCGDAGREGEVIQRNAYAWAAQRNPACDKPVLRLWISSLTDEAIRNGLRNLRPSSEYDPLFLAGKARAEADWLVGINATEALTVKAHLKRADGKTKVLSLGRVQTPTLALVCARYLENKNFKPVPFWTVKLHTESKDVKFFVVSDRRFDSFGEAESLSKRASISLLQVASAEHKAQMIKAPLLHDQTSIQQEASRRYDMSPEETLDIVQRLYEAKLVTYPRTGSRFIPKDVFNTLRGRIQNAAANCTDPALKAAALRLSAPEAKYNMRSVNDSKVTDHHALLIEKTPPPALSGKELKIYNLILQRMLEAVSPSCETDVLTCKFTCAGEGFHASSTRIVVPGWKGVAGLPKEDAAPKESPDAGEGAEPEQKLPELRQGDMLSVSRSETVQGQTKPKPLYTYESLLEAMKTAGKESDDDEVKAALKEIGIGTAATRAGIIQKIVEKQGYIRKQGKKLIPTDTGLEVYNLVKDMDISNVDLTGRWEIALAMIADGNGQMTGVFDGRIRAFTGTIVKQILDSDAGGGLAKAAEAENIKCPLCGGVMKVWDTNVRCTNASCGLSAFRTVLGKKLGQNTLKHLLENGKTGLVKGLVSPKTGKTFDARLKLEITEKEGRKYANARLVFDDKKPQTKKPFKK